MMGESDVEQAMTRREELIARVSPYCVKGDRLSKMLMIAADGLSFEAARKAVKGLDTGTYHCLMILGGHMEAPQLMSNDDLTAARVKRKQLIYRLIEEGLSFREICNTTLLGSETVGHYVALYAKEKGVERRELPCYKVKPHVKPSGKKLRAKHRPRVQMYLARINKGFKGESVAEILGIARSTYFRYERGEYNLPHVHIPILMQLLSISEKQLREQAQMDEAEYTRYLKTRPRLPEGDQD